MRNRDIPEPLETGKIPGNNEYSTHPFYMYQTGSQVWTGVFTNLNHAQDWYVKNNPEGGEVDLTTVSVGGVADIYIMLGSSPK